MGNLNYIKYSVFRSYKSLAFLKSTLVECADKRTCISEILDGKVVMMLWFVVLCVYLWFVSLCSFNDNVAFTIDCIPHTPLLMTHCWA